MNFSRCTERKVFNMAVDCFFCGVLICIIAGDVSTVLEENVNKSLVYFSGLTYILARTMRPNARCLTVAIADRRLTLTSSTICPHSADIALSFVLNYGSDLFQASFLLSWKLLVSVRRVPQRLNTKILRHFRFSLPRTFHPFFFFYENVQGFLRIKLKSEVTVKLSLGSTVTQ